VLGHAVAGDRDEHPALAIHSIRRAGLRAHEVHDFAHDEPERFGQVGLGRQDVGDRDEKIRTHSLFTIRQPDRPAEQIPRGRITPAPWQELLRSATQFRRKSA